MPAKRLSHLNSDELLEQIELIETQIDDGSLTLRSAIDLLKSYIHHVDDHFFLYTKLSEFSLVAGDSEASRHFLSLIKNPSEQNDYRVSILKAMSFALEGKDSPAHQILEHTPDASSSEGNAFFWLVCSHLEKGDYKRFRVGIATMVRYTNPAMENLSSWVWLCMQTSLIEEGLFLSKQLLAQKPETWTSYIGPAYFSERKGDYPAAREYLKKAQSFKDFKTDEFVENLKKRL